MDHPDPDALELHGPHQRQPRLQPPAVDVPAHGVHGRAERLDRLQHLQLHHVAGVQDRVGALQPLARTRRAACAIRAAGACPRSPRGPPGAKLATPSARSSVDRARASGARGHRFESCRARRMVAVARLVTFADVGDPDAVRETVQCRHEAVLVTAAALLLDACGWCSSGTWAVTSHRTSKRRARGRRTGRAGRRRSTGPRSPRSCERRASRSGRRAQDPPPRRRAHRPPSRRVLTS